MALAAVAATKKIWLLKGELTIQPSIANFWTSWGPRGLVSESLDTRWVSWDPPPRAWFKVNFDGSMQGNKARASFVVRNDI